MTAGAPWEPPPDPKPRVVSPSAMAPRRGPAAAAALLLVVLGAAQAFLAPTPLLLLQQQQQQQQQRPPRAAVAATTAAARSESARRGLWPSPARQQPGWQWRQRQQGSGPLRALEDGTGGEEEPTTELGKLLDKDPKDTPVLAYLGFVSVALLGLGIATFKLGGQLMGLGFADDSLNYWDAAPSYALLLVYPPLFLVFPEARGLLLKTLAFSFVVTAAIWAFPYEAIGWEPTNEHILITVATPVLGYLTFFCLRATKTYLEIVEEEAQERREREGGGDSR